MQLALSPLSFNRIQSHKISWDWSNLHLCLRLQDSMTIIIVSIKCFQMQDRLLLKRDKLRWNHGRSHSCGDLSCHRQLEDKRLFCRKYFQQTFHTRFSLHSIVQNCYFNHWRTKHSCPDVLSCCHEPYLHVAPPSSAPSGVETKADKTRILRPLRPALTFLSLYKSNRSEE